MSSRDPKAALIALAGVPFCLLSMVVGASETAPAWVRALQIILLLIGVAFVVVGARRLFRAFR
jgi:hypothetical protein